MQEKLFLLRKKKGVSKKELATLIGITDKQFSAKENGKTCFKSDEMFKIAEYFNLPIEDIFSPSTYQNGNN